MGEKTIESMNKELQDWIKETRELPTENKRPIDENRKPEGKCRICGQKDANFICLKCDQSVCSDCYFKIIGVCKQCIPESIVEKWKGKNPDWEKILGVQWVD